MILRQTSAYLLLAMALPAVATAQESGQLDVDDGRPLMAAADYLQETAHVAVNYEDPPFQFSGDVQDITDETLSPQQRAVNPSAKIMVPRGGRVVTPLPTMRSGNAIDVTSALTLARQAHEGSRFPGRFKVEQVGTSVVIEPVSVRNAAGEWESVSSVLETPISFPFATRSGAETLSLIFSTLQQSGGSRIDIAALPFALFANTHVAMGATEETARSKLLSLLEELSTSSQPRASGSLLSYRLLFDPGLMHHLLSIKPVPAPDPSSTGKHRLSPVRMQGLGYKAEPAN